VGSRFGCVENINNITPYTDDARLWTNPELYLLKNDRNSSAAKMYYLLFSPFWDVEQEKYKWICYKLEFGRRGDTNYKIIATKLYFGDICSEINIVYTNIREFIRNSIENFKKNMGIVCKREDNIDSGSGGGSGGGNSKKKGGNNPNEKRGGSHKRKPLRKRKTRRRK
jgi:hypothetical protein